MRRMVVLVTLLAAAAAAEGVVASERPGPARIAPDAAALVLVQGYGAKAPADAAGITPRSTKKIVDAIAWGASFCKSLGDPALNIDCLSDQYRYVADMLPQSGGYAGVRSALLDASSQLHAVAKANSDGTVRSRPRNKNGKSAHRDLTPVSDPAGSAPRAAAIIDATRTVLLRSSAGSDQRRLAFEAVAAVVDSTKVLLRSA